MLMIAYGEGVNQADAYVEASPDSFASGVV
jgi:hypothetical protein